MQPRADRVDTDTVTFVGPCFVTRADTDGWTRPAVADRLVELGVARRVDTVDATAETLREALNDLVADPERRGRSKQL
jgi:UDP:flavonoid glycosyltransferase YjiC (YdhE family)